MKIRYYQVLESRRTWEIWRHVPATSRKALQEKLDEVGNAEEVIGQTPDKTDGDDYLVDVQLEDDQQASERIHRQRIFHQEKVNPLIRLQKQVQDTFFSLVSNDLIEEILERMHSGELLNGYELVCDSIGESIDIHLDASDEELLLQLCIVSPDFFTSDPDNIEAILAEAVAKKFAPRHFVYHNVYTMLHLFLEEVWDTYITRRKGEYDMAFYTTLDEDTRFKLDQGK